MKKIAVFMRMEDASRQKIVDIASQYGYQADFYDTAQAYSENQDVEIILGNSTDVIDQTKNLKWLALYFAGVSSEILEKLPKSCHLTNSSGAYGVTMAEHMVMLTLMAVRGMPVFYESSFQHVWHQPIQQKSIKDACVTVLGAGDVGCHYAKRIRCFEPGQIIGINRSGVSREEVFDKIYPVSKLDEILPQTDILAMSLPGTPQTDHIMDAHRISLLPKSACIINVGRGSTIDEDALMDALDSGRLAAAGLDVFKNEPLAKDSSLWHTKNLIITPHVAGLHSEINANRKIVDMFCENIENYALHKPLQHEVDRVLGY